jgi:hypothetical protein
MVDVSDGYTEPEHEPDRWATWLRYPTGVTLANPGDSDAVHVPRCSIGRSPIPRTSTATAPSIRSCRDGPGWRRLPLPPPVDLAETTNNILLQSLGYENLATVLERAGRLDEVRGALECAFALCERKQCLPYARRIREQIDSLARAEV